MFFSNGIRIDGGLLKLADMVLYPGHHAAIITDLIYDADGNLTHVELCEETSGGQANPEIQGSSDYGSRRKSWLVEDFYTYFSEYSIYRYSLIDNVTYTPCRYVSVGEDNTMYYASMPLLPYMGDKFDYKVGHIYNFNLIVETSDFSYMQVVKDGINWSSDGTGNPYQITQIGPISVGFSETGSYEAYLCNIENGNIVDKSLSCYWTVT